jgi:RHS repeat-associated protein
MVTAVQGQLFPVGQRLTLADAFCLLTVISCSLVEGYYVWDTGALGVPATLTMQGDGNLVMTRADNDNAVLWATYTNSAENDGSTLLLQNDGNLVLHRANGTVVQSVSYSNGAEPPGNWLGQWGRVNAGHEIASPNGKYRLRNQDSDGNLVLYVDGWYPLWWTNPGANGYLVMQDDGNLVLRRGDGSYWTSWTQGHPWAHLEVLNDGNVVIYENGTHAVLWQTGTAGRTAPAPTLTINGAGSEGTVSLAPGETFTAEISNLPVETGYSLELYRIGDCCVSQVPSLALNFVQLTNRVPGQPSKARVTWTAPSTFGDYEIHVMYCCPQQEYEDGSGKVKATGPGIHVRSAPVIRYGNSAPPGPDVQLTYGASVTFTVKNPTGHREDWVGIFQANASDPPSGQPIQRQYLNGQSTPPDSGTTNDVSLTFSATWPPDNIYVARFFAGGEPNGAHKAQSLVFYVLPPPATVHIVGYQGSPQAPSTYTTGQTIQVSVNGLMSGTIGSLEIWPDNDCCSLGSPLEGFRLSGTAPTTVSIAIPASSHPDWPYSVSLVHTNYHSGEREELGRTEVFKIAPAPPPVPTLTVSGQGAGGTVELLPGQAFEAVAHSRPYNPTDKVWIVPVGSQAYSQARSLVSVDASTEQATFADGLTAGSYDTRLVICPTPQTCDPSILGPTLHVGLASVLVNGHGFGETVPVSVGDTLHVVVTGGARPLADQVVFVAAGSATAAVAHQLNGSLTFDMPAPSVNGSYDVQLLTNGTNTPGGTYGVAGYGPTLQMGALLGVDTVYYYDTDAIGSVRLITNEAGAVAARKMYLPFGSEWQPTSTPEGDRVLFAGKERDPESGLDYSMARYLSDNIGRFLSADSSTFGRVDDPQSWNLYAYARNNPVRFVDPSGHECVDGYDVDKGYFCGKIIGVSIGEAIHSDPPPLTNFRFKLFTTPSSGTRPTGPTQQPSPSELVPQNPCLYQGNAMSPGQYAAIGAIASAMGPLPFLAVSTAGFPRGMPLDSQPKAAGNVFQRAAYGNYAYGAYMGAAGVSYGFAMNAANAFGALAIYTRNGEMDKTYSHLPIANVINITNGFISGITLNMCSR